MTIPQKVKRYSIGELEHQLHTTLSKFWHKREWFLDTPKANKLIQDTIGPICEFKQ